MLQKNKAQKYIADSFGQLPSYFIPNIGQLEDQRIHYYSKGSEGGVCFTTEGASFTFSTDCIQTNQDDNITNTQGLEELEKGVKAFNLDFRFLNVNNRVTPEVRKEMSGKVNYLRGNDSSKWHTNISIFQEVVYPELWTGIDLIFRWEKGKIKYEFLIQPDAKVEDICFTYTGAKELLLDEQGNLLIHTPFGLIKDERPFSYQEKNGEIFNLSSNFQLSSNKKGEYEITFKIDSNYDSQYPLTIDPVLLYSSYLGGTGDESAENIAVDTFGNAYVTGATRSATGFPIENAFQPIFGGDRDVFVAKIDPNGSLIYSSYLGGSGYEDTFDLAIDTLGNAYVTGYTESATDFPIVNAFQPTFGGGDSDAFVTKIDPTGLLVYSSYLGGSGFDGCLGIDVDTVGNAYMIGVTDSVTGFPIVNAFQPTFGGGNRDVFVTKIDPNGLLVYSSYLGGTGLDQGSDIAVDSLGNAYVTGATRSATGFPIINAFQPTFGGGLNDAFITKIDPNGLLVYSSYLGGTENESVNRITIDILGNAFVAGFTSSPTGTFPIINAFQPTFGGGNSDAFVTKIDPNGLLVYSSYLGGTGDDTCFGIDVDTSGNAFVTGHTSSPTGTFPIINAFQPTFGGGDRDAFVTKINSTGSLVYSSYLGGAEDDLGNSITVDTLGNAYVTGATRSATGFPIINAFQPTFGGDSDAFVTKIDPNGLLVYSSYLGGTGSDSGIDITLDTLGNAYIILFTQSVTGFPIINAFQPTFGGGNSDASIVKIGSLICPPDRLVNNDVGQCGAFVNYISPIGVTCSPPSGSFFPIGTTLVTCTDSSGSETCSFKVTVNDIERPTITCPTNITQSNDPKQRGAIVNYPPPTASDNCPGVTTSCFPPSGSFFPIGTTPVTCTATDVAGNTTTCSFTITVNDTEQPIDCCNCCCECCCDCCCKSRRDSRRDFLLRFLLQLLFINFKK